MKSILKIILSRKLLKFVLLEIVYPILEEKAKKSKTKHDDMLLKALKDIVISIT